MESQNSEFPGEDLDNPLENATVDGSRIVFTGEPDPQDRDGRRLDADKVRRFLTEERFSGLVAKALEKGKKSRGWEIEVCPEDDDFRDACAALYHRYFDGLVSPILERFSDDAIEDIAILAMGFGPIILPIFKTELANARARKRGLKEAPNLDGKDVADNDR